MSGVTFQESIEGRYVFAGNSISDGGNMNIHLPPERPDTPPHPSSSIIPFRRDPNFVPRGDILDRLHELCSKPAGRAALVGLGGVGKSQLAIEFAHQLKAANTASEVPAWIFWVHASTASRIEQGFSDIAEAIKIPDRTKPGADIMKLVYSTLSKEVWGRWCMILDSCDDYDILFSLRGSSEDERSVATYLPQSENGSILVTTRNRDIAYKLTNENQAIIPVGPMLEREAISLLESRLGPLSNAGTASDLVQALDLIPLAISQAAAHIQARQPLTSMDEYLADFRASESQRIRLLNYDAGDLRRDGGASNAVLTTWKLSFEHIRSKWPSAANLLSLMSFFNPQGIPKWLLEHSKTGKTVTSTAIPSRRETEPEGHDKKGDKRSFSSLLHRLSGKVRLLKRSDPNTNTISALIETLEYADIERHDSTNGRYDTFDDDVCILRDYFLVRITEVKDMFEMHGLVQLSTRKWLKDNGLQDDFKQQYLCLLSKWFPSGDFFENRKTCEELFPHVQLMTKYFPKSESVQEDWPVSLGWLFYNSGSYSFEKSSFDMAGRMLETSLIIYKKNFGKEDRLTLRCISGLAKILRKKGQNAEAEKLLLEVLEIQKNVLETNDSDITSNMRHLSLIYLKQRRFDEAERLQVQVLEMHKNLRGIEDVHTLVSMSSLSKIYMETSRLDEAKKLQLQAIEISKNLLGADHPNTLATMGNLAKNYYWQEQYDEAAKLQLQVLEKQRCVLGTNHYETVRGMESLARIYESQGHYEQAGELWSQALEIRKNLFGTKNPKILHGMYDLALMYSKQGRHLEAEELLSQLLEIRKNLLGNEHHKTSNTMSRIASVYLKQGRYDDAEKLWLQVLEIRKNLHGTEEPETLNTMSNIASVYFKQGRNLEALEMMRACAQGRAQVLGEDHPSTIRSLTRIEEWSQTNSE